MSSLAEWGQVAMPGDAKARNRQLMLRAIRSGKALTAAEIHQMTGISRQTVMRFLQYYCAKGIIRSVGHGSSTRAGGKKPELFQFCDERMILCVNLWPDSISLAMSSLTGEVFGAKEYAHTLYDVLDEGLSFARRQADSYLAQYGLSLDRLYGVVLSVPGTVDDAAQILRYNSQAPGWGTDVDMQKKLTAVFGDSLKFYVGNAGKAAGRALLSERPEYETKRMMTFFTTWGVSACLMDKGHVLNGCDSLIGEIGHMIISDGDEVVCGCGKRGCLESMVSLSRMKKMLLGAGESEARCSALTVRGLFEQSAQGDPAARRLSAYLAHCFAVALQNLSLSYNQELVVFQGDFAWADRHFDECIREELSAFRYFPQGRLFDIVYDRRELALLAAKGGADRLIQKYFDDLTEE